MLDFVIKSIYNVLNLIDKGDNQEEKKIAHSLVEKFEDYGFLPKKQVKPFFYFNTKKNQVGYTNYKGKTEIVSVGGKDKFDKYIGASLAYFNSVFGSKTKYHKELQKFFGVDFKQKGVNVEQYSILYAYSKFGGKENFEKFVNDNLPSNQKGQ